MNTFKFLLLTIFLSIVATQNALALSSFDVSDSTTVVNLIVPPSVGPVPPISLPPPASAPTPNPSPAPTPSPEPITSPEPTPPSPVSSSSMPSSTVLDAGEKRATSTLIINTKDSAGRNLKGVGIIVDVVSAASSAPGVRFSPEFKKLDKDSAASFILKEGTYYIRGVIDPDSGLLNAEEMKVEVKENEAVDLNLLFKRKDSASLARFAGSTVMEDGTPADAIIRAWSDKGGYAETRSSGGKFELELTLDDQWHVGASSEVARIPYRSSEILYKIKDKAVSADIILSRVGEKPLSPAVNISKDARENITVKTEDGMAAYLPSESAARGGTIQLQVKATSDAPILPAARPIGNAYDITIKDSDGNAITALLGEIELVLPYDLSILQDLGVSEDALVPSYFDDDVKAWIRINNYTIDKDKNVVVARINHITRFALVAAADVTPPDDPRNVSAVVMSTGKIKILWSNPKRDFDHAKIYRSENQASLGGLLVQKTVEQEFLDNSVKTGSTYYYTVRAVDPAGNESNSSSQVGIKAVTTSGERVLKIGFSGMDVKGLQEFLIREGHLQGGYNTGYFGRLTERAVRDFQEKYASEILMPLGLDKGTGIVGIFTRKKINTLQ